eukprot:3625365-Rhodomonas_salina.1
MDCAEMGHAAGRWRESGQRRDRHGRRRGEEGGRASERVDEGGSSGPSALITARRTWQNIIIGCTAPT